MSTSDDWIAHLTQERRPANTVAAARRVMRSLPNASDATREDVEAWWASRAHLSPATRSNDLAILRTFYAWCRRWEHRDDDPTARLDAPKVDKGLPRPLSRADLHRLLAVLPAEHPHAHIIDQHTAARHESERPDPLPRCGFTHGDWCMGERGRPGHTHRTDCPERVAPVLRWREGIDCERVGGES